ncbi:MAG TPA: hypothetical protein VGF21_02085 [Thermoleophilaceae bacterium]|jgi:hypothetical protein
MPVLVEIRWAANPFRGDKFAAGWLPAAEAAMDYGALSWAFYRAQEGGLDFVQHAVFPTKADFERYWYSETAAETRTELSGYFQVPLLPTIWDIVGSGATLAPSPDRA